MSIDKFDPEMDDQASEIERDLEGSEETGPDKGDLSYNADDDSFELDVTSDDPDYDHPDPYDTSVKNGEDINSSYDEANPYDTAGEYDAKRSLETDADKLGMHIDDGDIVELDPVDELLARTPEDDRDDLDEEGYPKNDQDKNFLK